MPYERSAGEVSGVYVDAKASGRSPTTNIQPVAAITVR
jgi:hypothetical protein